MITHSAE